MRQKNVSTNVVFRLMVNLAQHASVASKKSKMQEDARVINTTMNWMYKEKEYAPTFEEIQADGLCGFVYIITNQLTGRKYIGQKKLISITRRKVKGKTRRVTTKSMSNWQDYWGSSRTLLEDVEKFGKEHFTREILDLCEAKGLMNYLELKYQMERNVLFTDDYYNGIVNIRLNETAIRNYGDRCKF